MSKRVFFGQKLVLSTGREVDIACDQESENAISLIAMLNHQDPIHKITKPLSIRFEWNTPEGEDSDAIVSIECRGGAPHGTRPISESELPIDGLNGTELVLKLRELQEIQNKAQEIYKKVLLEI